MGTQQLRGRESRSFKIAENKDHRNGLFTIFVDNLHPSVDQRCLWDIFKIFGRVRDIFMSSSQRMRKRNFAFVRFASMEEAEKVSRLSNGMHVYRWPIVVKVAIYGWDKRRVEKKVQSGRVFGETVKKTNMVGGDIRKLVKECEGPKGGGYGGNGRLRTFTEVVSGGGPGGFSGAKVDTEESINVKVTGRIH
ncbi:hypothetical protein Q3G72_021197 [Acer saccharum]|nr:hypothetical protein Q3G72_021197 [Acer saccharum]